MVTGASRAPSCSTHRASLFDTEQRMVFGATTFRENAAILLSGDDPHSSDEWNVRTMRMPATVISSTLDDTLGWPNATIVSGDAVDIVSPTQGGVGRSAALASQSVAELGPAGRRTGGPSPGDDLPRHLGKDRYQPNSRRRR